MNADLMLVIDNRDTRLTLDGRALRLESPDAALRHIPLGVLGLVVVHGRALVGCEVWRALAERGIPAVLQSSRGHGAAAWMSAALGSTVALRTAQHRAADRTERRLACARRILIAKLHAHARAAAVLSADSAPRQADTRLGEQLAEARRQLNTAPTLAALMGHEGTAARAWYQWLATRLPAHWQFRGRNRRPPRDPVNALLSLGYTLLGGEMLGAVQQQGLDPARGVLHDLVPGRESLVLDLIEPLRPSVDLVIVSLLDTVLGPQDFTTSAEDGCRLGKDGRNRFYHAWAHARRDWPDLQCDEALDSDPTATTLAQCCWRETASLREDLKDLMPAMDDRS
ncbi:MULTISPECIES: CRISPR-associated endonuclease Cas1 [unclassified Thiocapsa]|uniref:CRISPR-associated endonuclease Cas1 n=1 Tax=unclassified Thiocapsa TaxID=2641286 RepID=UPI0035B4C909